MTDARIWRLFVASLHRAIGDVLPGRLSFYEYWLHSRGFREGAIRPASLMAVLSFLRQEGDAYDQVVSLAGKYTAELSVEALPILKRFVMQVLPRWLRARMVFRMVSDIIRRSSVNGSVSTRIDRGTVVFENFRSPFCDVRGETSRPMCSFYAAAGVRFLELFDISATSRIESCRSSGSERCALFVVVDSTR